MSQLIWRTYKNQWDPKMTAFRHSLVSELGVDPEYLNRELTHADVKAELSDQLGEDFEEIYKYCDSKWKITPFDLIEAAEVDGEIVAISAARTYGRWYRCGMHLYVLKSARREHRSLFWRESGFLQRHIATAKQLALDGVFVSIFAHNKHLKFFVKYMNETERTLSPMSPIATDIKNMKALGDPVMLNSVPQHVFYLGFGETANFSTSGI